MLKKFQNVNKYCTLLEFRRRYIRANLKWTIKRYKTIIIAKNTVLNPLLKTTHNKHHKHRVKTKDGEVFQILTTPPQKLITVSILYFLKTWTRWGGMKVLKNKRLNEVTEIIFIKFKLKKPPSFKCYKL